MDKHYFDYDKSVMSKVLGIVQQNKTLALKFTISNGDVHIFRDSKLIITLNQRVFNMLEANEILQLIHNEEGDINGKATRER